MAKPILVWYARKYDAGEWANAVNLPDFQSVQDSVLLAASDAGLGAGDGAVLAYRVTGDQDDDRLSVFWPQLPQLLFSVPADPANAQGPQVFVAKLVQDQISRKNIALMLETVKRFQAKIDPATQQTTFYDPTLHWLPSIGVSNSAQAPGAGYMLGLNPWNESLTINRYGQMFGGLAKFLPWLLIGGAVYLAKKNKWV